MNASWRTEALGKEVLARLQGTQLFYPSSGEDDVLPVKAFVPHVTEYWFADVAYFRQNDPIDRSGPMLGNGFKFLGDHLDCNIAREIRLER
jgi:hypothetical protein